MSVKVPRRNILGLLAGAPLAFAATQAGAQAPAAAPAPSALPQPKFGFDDVVSRARDMARFPFDATAPRLPSALENLTFDQYRDIRFKPDRAFLDKSGTGFRLQLFHPGFIYRRPVVVNIVRDGLATPIPFAPALFDMGKNHVTERLPPDLGFAGLRVHYPLNDPRQTDELISFLGASYFRFLGRAQKYGLSARAVAVNSGTPREEFPYFREFWVETPASGSETINVHALLDGESLTGAFRFAIYPTNETVVDVQARLFIRRPIERLGLAPLTSMFFYGETERKVDDYRPELHDSDGLLLHSATGEWLWRPLRNPAEPVTSSFLDKGVRGFGLMQRDRTFEHYQDLDLVYEQRPSYWIEPNEGFGEGRVDLVELPTADETNDNVVAYWAPAKPVEAGQTFALSYRITSLTNEGRVSPGGMALNTFRTKPVALGSGETPPPYTTRFIIDFAGGDLEYYLGQPDLVQIVPSATNGKILRTFIMPNPQIRGFRAGIDVTGVPGQTTDLRAFLKVSNKALTETWTYPWRA